VTAKARATLERQPAAHIISILADAARLEGIWVHVFGGRTKPLGFQAGPSFALILEEGGPLTMSRAGREGHKAAAVPTLAGGSRLAAGFNKMVWPKEGQKLGAEVARDVYAALHTTPLFEKVSAARAPAGGSCCQACPSRGAARWHAIIMRQILC
jgi:hypothetical protein